MAALPPPPALHLPPSTTWPRFRDIRRDLAADTSTVAGAGITDVLVLMQVVVLHSAGAQLGILHLAQPGC